jgi:hypothetical protein
MLQAHPELVREDLVALRYHARTPVGLRQSFGGWQLDHGLGSPELDLLNGAVPPAHDFTMVTHNQQDHDNILGLSRDDWLVP